MGRRLELQAIFKTFVDNVYFQPPPNVHLIYPCIVYERAQVNVKYAGNKPYAHKKRYQVTVISNNPDDNIVDEVAMLPLCSHDRFFTADNLNHDVFTIYF
jgi:hypothetical protein